MNFKIISQNMVVLSVIKQCPVMKSPHIVKVYFKWDQNWVNIPTCNFILMDQRKSILSGKSSNQVLEVAHKAECSSMIQVSSKNTELTTTNQISQTEKLPRPPA